MKKNNSINAGLTQTGIAPKSSIKFLEEINHMRAIKFSCFATRLLMIVMTFMLFSLTLVAAPADKIKGKDDKSITQKEQAKLRAQIMDDLRSQDGRKEFSPEELEQMRGALLDLLDTVKLMTTLPSVNNGFGEKSKGEDYESLKEQIQNMSGKELNVLRAALNPLKMQAKLAESRIVLETFKNRVAQKASPTTANRPGFPEVDPYCDYIPTTAEYRAAQIALIVAEGVRDIAQNGCNEVIVALGFGGNARLLCLITDAIYIVAKGVTYDTTFCYEDYTGALTAANYNRLDHLHEDVEDVKSSNSENFSNIINTAAANTTTITGAVTGATTTIVSNADANKTMIVNNDNSNKDTIINNASQNTTTLNTSITDAKNTIVNNDNSNKTAIVNNDNQNALTLNTNLTNAKNTIVANDNANTTNIVNNDNANKTTIVNNDNANTTTLLNSGNANTLALNDLILRSQIEADLAMESNGVTVAWYMTPTANGGKLDLVKQIVTLTLANIQAAGGSIGNAQSFLDRANADKAAGNFKSAYDNYRKAYKAAAN